MAYEGMSKKKPLGGNDLKKLPWVGAIYRFDRDHFAVKLNGHDARVVKFDKVIGILYDPGMEDVEPRAPAPDEGGR